MDTIIVTANLGHLKAYRVNQTPTRGLKLDLVEDLSFPDAHGRFSEKVTDFAGRFPVTQGAGPSVQMSSTEALTAGQEIERRLTKLVGEQLQTVLERERPEQWYFSATPEIRQAILEKVDPRLRERLLRSPESDLTKIPAAEVLGHFGLG